MASWSHYCHTREFKLAVPDVWVLFASGRKHRVRVVDEGTSYRLVATVVGRRVVERLIAAGDEAFDRLAIRILQRNRSAPLVGFRLTPAHKLIAESQVVKIGLERDEFRLHLRRVAVEADQMEFLLTGEDRN